MSMISKQPNLQPDARIGILNRGEAAMRFIRAVKEYNALHGTNLKTVAFYIDKEESAPFVKNADDDLALSSLSLFPGQQKSPYLDHELMLEAIKTANCQAIWVGWGFVSEDAPFAEKVEKAGVIFMGPSSGAMALLGDKIQAKDLAESAGVPILPWSKKSVDTLEDAKRVSEEIGYPVIVKAANAGGGRGIRFVRTPADLETQYNSAKDETIRITGNSVVFIERLVESGRHLEVQCLADYHGIVNTFGVRDCSVQRKNQKIIEETPPPQFSDEIVKSMEENAANLLLAAEYYGAGTVEYLYDLKRNEFYFMEVNTRLQVEHPITETLYGIDLVKGQIDVAFGNKVDLRDRKPNGWVMEVRLNAEDPDRDFNPAPGEVNLFKTPAGAGIRVDSGIEQGSEIPSEFDSMVAKVIAHGNDRPEAMARLKRALNELRIRIINGTTNRAFLLELLDNPDIIEGGVHTGYVEELLEDRKSQVNEEKARLALISGAIEMYHQQYKEELINFKQQLRSTGRPRSTPKAAGKEIILANQGNSYTFFVKSMGNNIYHLEFENLVINCEYYRDDQEGILIINGKRYNTLLVPRGDMIQMEVDGYPVMLESDSGGYVSSPSPAIVLNVNVKEGQQVKKGDVLIVLEAMKMEMLVEAPGDGIVNEICIGNGEQVAAGQPLVQLEMGEQDEEEVTDTVEPVSFSTLGEKDLLKQLREEFQALFLGYDHNNNVAGVVDKLLEIVKEDGRDAAAIIECFLKSITNYSVVEALFVKDTVKADSFARPMTCPELLSHFFRRDIDRDKGLPQVFLDSLNRAFEQYPASAQNEIDSQDEALFHIYRSHGELKLKNQMLQKLLFNLEELNLSTEQIDSLSAILEELIQNTQKNSQTLADAALNAKYLVVDKPRVDALKQKQYDAAEETLKLALKESVPADATSEGIERIADVGPFIMKDLVDMYIAGDDKQKHFTLKVLGERLNRDRTIESRGFENTAAGIFYVVKGSDKNGAFSSAVTVATEAEAANKDFTSWAKGKVSEVVLLISSDDGKDKTDIYPSVIKAQDAVKDVQLSIGIYHSDRTADFASFCADKTWTEIELMHGFSPLQYRELRVYRLSTFNLEILYQSEHVTLVQAVAKSNPKDVRLFALGSVDETGLVMEENEIERMVMFEAVLMEAISAMRVAQAKYRFRLQWNRIIIHNRSLLSLKMMQLSKYGMSFIDRISDLGLEKVVIYTRRKRWREEVIRELELHLMNFADEQFNLRSRKASEKPLSVRNEYTTKVVTARQRNTYYPYELIKMITQVGVPLYENMPKGEFEEFDIEIDKAGNHKAVSVAGREAGSNESNVVFGIISNTDNLGLTYKRVLLLSDPTTDMGSLSEPECRRVMAAIDMADEMKLPVEWLPISSGAKINMDSGTENLDWTAAALKRIVDFTQTGGEINIIVSGINVGAQSYWNAEATMLMHTKGLLIQTDDASQLLTGKKALDFAGAVSGETNTDIGGVESIMGPNGQSQVRVPNLTAAYQVLFNHYKYTYVPAGERFPASVDSADAKNRDITSIPYKDILDQGFETIGDIFSIEKNPERKKPFDIRQVMKAVIDTDAGFFERYQDMSDADTSIVWETRMGGNAVGMIGIESRNIQRIGEVPFDGPETWNGGTLFPLSSKKVARGINAFSGKVPLVIMANLSGFDGSPESLRRLQLEYGAEIGRAVVNFDGPIVFVVVARYHGGAYVVFSKSLNTNLKSAAIEGSFASVLGGAPAAAVVFPKMVAKEASSDKRIADMQEKLEHGKCTQKEFNSTYQKVYAEKQTELGQKFDKIHSVQRAKEVGSIDDIITAKNLRPYIIENVEAGKKKFANKQN